MPHVDWDSVNRMSLLLAALPPAARRTARRIAFAEGARVFNRGDRPRVMYYVLAGEVHLLRHTASGAPIVLQRARDGIVAEASLDQPAYHCDALAARASTLLALSRSAIAEALSEEHFRNTWISHLARELRRVRAQSERLNLRTAQERIIHYIETEGEEGIIQLRTSKKDWAAELGLTHEALYRTLARLQRAGIIAVLGRSITRKR